MDSTLATKTSSKTRLIRVSIVAALVAIAAIMFVISVSSSDTNTIVVQDKNVTKVDPTPGGLMRSTSEISVDLADGYTGRLVIDGKSIPDDEVIMVKSLGQITFRVGKGKTFEKFTTGPHLAQIIYWKSDESENVNPGEYHWDFRVTV